MHATTRKITLALAALLAFAALPTLAQEEGENKALALFLKRPQLLVRELHMTQAQATSLRGFVTETRNAIKPIGTEIQTINQQIRDLLAGSNPDACQVGALVVSRHDKYEQIEALLGDFDDDIISILTAAQVTEYEKLKDEINNRR